MTRRKRSKPAGRAPEQRPAAAAENPPAQQAARGLSRARWAIGLVLAIPMLLALAYGLLTQGLGTKGSPAGSAAVAIANHPRVADAGAAGAPAPAPSAGSRSGASPVDFEQLAARLAERLEAQPEEQVGWNTLAHTYYVLKRFPEAANAYERLVALADPDADTLADYADALAMAQGRQLEGKPMELVRRSLELDPRQWKALSMAATYAFEREDYAGAIGYWERALAGMPPDAPLAQRIEANIAQARTLGAAKPAEPAKPAGQ